MKTIVKVLYGSRLYGTQLPTSDVDFKLVYLPSLDDLLENKSMSRNWVTQGDLGPQDKIEYEAFDFRRYVELMLGGQTIGIDLLFSNPSDWVEVQDEWLEFIKHRDTYVSKNIMPFIGYARGQALKYGEKGDRLKTVIDFREAVLRSYSFHSNLVGMSANPPTPGFWKELVTKFKDRDGVKLKSETKNGVTVEMIEVVGKTFGNTTSMKLWIEPLEKLYSSFGKRANQAMKTDGHDLKAQYHCLRIIEEATELLLTGKVTFPRPEKDLLLSIRKGELSKTEVEVIVSGKLNYLEDALKLSKLPDKPSGAEYAKEFAKNCIKNYIKETS